MTERDLDILDKFVAAMRAELHANAWKGEWTSATKGHRAWQVLYHALKLVSVMMEDQPQLNALREYAADTANEAMFIADSVGALDLETTTEAHVITKVAEPRAFSDAVRDLEDWMRKHFDVTDQDLIPESQQPRGELKP